MFNNITTNDIGLKQYMLSVYNNLALGLILSGLVSYFIATTPELSSFFYTGIQSWLFMVMPLVIVMFISFSYEKLSLSSLKTLYVGLTIVMGISLSTIFSQYKMGNITEIFFITASTFLVTSLYGYTTKRDLTSIGNIMIMGLYGIIIALIVNMFLMNSAMSYVISCVGVVVFVGLIAWDTQRIKDYYYKLDAVDHDKAGIIGALNLYLDVVNLFLDLLHLGGND